MNEETSSFSMAASQQSSAKWQIVEVIGEGERKATYVNVYAAKIDSKIANSFIRELNSKAPLPVLSHVKRIRRCLKDGTFELSIILCKVDGDELDKEIKLPMPVSHLVDKYGLQPFVAAVAEHPARSKEEWETQCQLWPTSYHPNLGKLTANNGLSQADADTMLYFMEIVVEQARLAYKHGKFANAAIIVDPALGAVIARGHDETATSSPSLCHGSQRSPGYRDVETQESTLSDGWHPLQHAVMTAIQMVAERDTRLWPSEIFYTTEKNIRDAGCSVVRRKRQRSVEDIKMSTISADNLLLSEDGEAIGVTSALGIARPYLCTDFDLYVAREPCAMCAMAMVHQRLRRVIYGIPNVLIGALGSRYKLHSLASLNHHYTVYQVSLSEGDLL